MTVAAGRVHEMEHHTADWTTTRPVVSGTQGVVASGHPLVSMAGMRMLLAGGNAFDAAVAAGFAAAGGGADRLVHALRRVRGPHPRRAERADALAEWPGHGARPGDARVLPRARARQDPHRAGVDAHLSFTVPGAVDAYLTVLETLGTRSVSEVLAPALSYAEHGFPMYEYMHRLLDIAESRTQFDLYPPGGTAVFYPGGRVPEVGDLFVQPALARTLSRLVEAAAGRRGHRRAGIGAARERFYRGDIAAAIGAFSEGLDGLLRADDLAGYRARLEAPLKTTFAGREILGQAGWTQGPVLLQALGMLEAFDLRAMGHNSVRYIHVVTEALKLAFADRERFYGDSADTGVQISELLAPAYARERAAQIRMDRAAPEAPAPGDPRRHGGMPAGITARAATEPPAAIHAPDGTTHIAAIDRDGNMMCLTPSGGVFRKSAFAPELGCTLSTRSEMFVLEDGHPNALAPGKRPRTSLVSYLICDKGVPTTSIGCPGATTRRRPTCSSC
jgi:gamma-glutamyltranspeptidase/glutathione hydrolase